MSKFFPKGSLRTNKQLLTLLTKARKEPRTIYLVGTTAKKFHKVHINSDTHIRNKWVVFGPGSSPREVFLPRASRYRYFTNYWLAYAFWVKLNQPKPD